MENERYTCPLCGSDVDWESTEKHHSSEHGEVRICANCHRKITSREQRNRIPLTEEESDVLYKLFSDLTKSHMKFYSEMDEMDRMAAKRTRNWALKMARYQLEKRKTKGEIITKSEIEETFIYFADMGSEEWIEAMKE